jgi:ABC-2 type transport system ATP-binding protein
LIGSPPVIILDEPTVGLDPQQVVEIRELIKNLGEKHTVLLSTHILSEVSLLCSRALIMNRGEIVAEILIDPLKPSVEIEQAFLKAISKEGIG